MMEIKDNTFSRQFETHVDDKLIALEYALQERKIFLTKLTTPDGFDDEDFISAFLKEVMEIIQTNKWRVVPTYPKVVKFFKANPVYKELLPPGIKI